MACALPTEDQQERETDLVCKPHGLMAVLACVQCDEALCCQNCVINFHECHEFKTIATLIQEKRKKIENHIKLLKETKVPQLNEQLRQAQLMMVQMQSETNTSEAERALDERAALLKAELDKVINQTVRRCEEMAFENHAKLQVYKDHMENILTEYRQKLAEIERVLDEGTVEEILHLRKNLPPRPVYPQYPDLVYPTLTPGDPSHLLEAFGSLVITKEGDDITDVPSSDVVRDIEELD